MNGKIITGKAEIELFNLDKESIDLFLVDTPFGTTQSDWDKILDLPEMWKGITHSKKIRTPTLHFAKAPYSIVLASSNLKQFKHEWIWEKNTATGHLNSGRMPMQAHENIQVYYERLPLYKPQKTKGHKLKTSLVSQRKNATDTEVYSKHRRADYSSTERHPRSVLRYDIVPDNDRRHTNQKPLDLLINMILTYTNPGDTVCDFCAGSGSVGRACQITGRKLILIEKDPREVAKIEAWLSMPLSEYEKGLIPVSG
jgi:site-specific DNA-methyltransferase (adenine-specific)